MIDVTKQNYWGDGQVYPSPNGSSTEPIIRTDNSSYWGDGQVWLYPFVNVSGIVYNKIQLMIVRMSGLS